MAEMKTLTIIDNTHTSKTYTVTDPDAANIDDTITSPDKTWSSKNIVDKLCPAFEETGPVVTCEPVEGYPLSVVSTIEPSTDGYTNTKLTRCGKNILDVSTAGVYHNNSSSPSKDISVTKTGLHIEALKASSGDSYRCGFCLGTVKELVGKTLTLANNYLTSANGNPYNRIGFYGTNVKPTSAGKKPIYANGGYIGLSGSTKQLAYSTEACTYTVTGDEECEYIAILFYFAAGCAVVIGDLTEISNVQVEIGDTATAYEPYRGESFTMEFGGTVYGGSLDWNSGVLTVTHGSDGAELAEPYTIQLTPQEIAGLEGLNTLYADNGNITVSCRLDPVSIIKNQKTINEDLLDRVAALEAAVVNNT